MKVASFILSAGVIVVGMVVYVGDIRSDGRVNASDIVDIKVELRDFRDDVDMIRENTQYTRALLELWAQKTGVSSTRIATSTEVFMSTKP